ncbi:peptidoglycan editing factor PgeF [Alkalihalobacillus macyae]|uniref:peptidoglycan editing factor PgeF n=1 Tax=Guptibacillus hwajinpoensis TaxID=208199 RepID=UPI00273B9435|nr:peptidoglycan editing factor PgeF [Alkalihalobacillus macyae]MDP4553082.1 peptidoglycan editing factor PgeF [Alkalihalobacillus macyae]
MKEPFQQTTALTSLALQFADQANRGSNLKAGFTTRRNGVSLAPFSSLNLGFHVPDLAKDVLANRNKLAEDVGIPLDQWAVGEQIHGSALAKVTSNEKGRGTRTHEDAISLVDGLYTDEKDLLLTALYADCVPLYFYAKEAGRVGIAHAGWKGTTKNIAGEMITAWNKDGIKKEDIQVAIGPSIGKCCYEVDEGVINEVMKVTKNSNGLFEEKANGKYQLDLKEVNKDLLLKSGIKQNHIAVSQYCTSCSNLFFSHRSENGKTGRMMGYIGLEEV